MVKELFRSKPFFSQKTVVKFADDFEVIQVFHDEQDPGEKPKELAGNKYEKTYQSLFILFLPLILLK